jgi:hypothetical protein
MDLTCNLSQLLARIHTGLEKGEDPSLSALHKTRDLLTKEIWRRESGSDTGRWYVEDFPPYGWTWHPTDTADLVEDQDEQAVIAQIVDLRQQGMTNYQICQELEKHGLAYRGNPRWHKAKVRAILERRARQQ